MKKFPLTLLAVSCAVALSACSSNSGKGYDMNAEYVKKATDAKVAAEQSENAIKAKLDEAVAKLKEAEEKFKTAENQPSDQKQSEEQAAKLKDVEEKLKTAENKLNETTVTSTEQLQNAQNEINRLQGLLDDAQKVKLEEERINTNKQIIKEDLLSSLASSTTKESNGVTLNILGLSGATLSINNGAVTAKAIEPTHNINQLDIDGHTVTLFDSEFIKEKREAYSGYDSQWGYSIKGQAVPFKEINETITDSTGTKTVVGKVGSLAGANPKDNPSVSTLSDFEQMRFGYITVNDITQLFLQGYVTPSETDSETRNRLYSPYSHWNYTTNREGEASANPLPTSGLFYYKGYSVYGKDNEYKEYATEGIADLNNKKVQVEIADANIKMAANIKADNTVEGLYNDIQVKGAFFGSEGQDLGGIFYQTAGEQKDYNGVFGITKVNGSGEDKGISCNWRGCAELDPSQSLEKLEIK